MDSFLSWQEVQSLGRARSSLFVALSTTEAEYVAAREATMEAVSARNVISEVLPTLTMEVRIGIDSQSAYVLA